MKTITEIREDFPYLKNNSNIYLDNGASSQKPSLVIDGLREYSENGHANIHRGAYALSVNATEKYENARLKVANLVGAALSEEIIFTKGATESINLVAATYGEQNIEAGDEIVLTIFEHHSNIVPWQQLALRKNAKLIYIYENQSGQLDLEEAAHKITSKTKIVAMTGISNALGSKMPVREVIKLAHQHQAVVLIDGAQWISHEQIDVQALDIDFLVFSGHKMYGPTGIGVLYGKKRLLEAMNPYQLGGDMIEYVSEQTTTYAPLPNKFEAGTPPIEPAIGLGYAIDYLLSVGYDQIEKLEKELTAYAYFKLSNQPGITLYGPLPEQRGPVISFNMLGLHPHDMATLLDEKGISIRAGHHCAQPLMKRFGLNATCRISFGIYNTKEEIDQLATGLDEIWRWLEQWR